MKKSLLMIVIMILSISLSSCGSKDVMLDTNYEGDSSTNIYTTKDSDEYHSIMYPDEYPTNPYDIESEVIAVSEVKLGEYKKDSESVDCTVSAPDVYSFLMENQEKLMNLNEEELYKTIRNAIENEEIGTREITIALPVQEVNGELVADTNTAEYRDAVSGGMYSALTDIYVSILSDAMEVQK